MRNRNKLNTLNAAIATAIGIGSSGFAQADSMTGTIIDAGGTSTSTGATVSQTSPYQNLTFGLQTVGASYVGVIAGATMSATATTGENTSGVSTIAYSTVVTNSGTAASPFALAINIGNSSLLAVDQISFGSGTQTETMSVSANVSVNGSSVWGSSASLVLTNDFAGVYSNPNPYSLNTSGAAFAGYAVQNVFAGAQVPYETVSFSPYSYAVPLGVLNPGQSENVIYTLVASAQQTGGFEGYGGGISTVGDPFGVLGSPAFQVEAAPVPLPAPVELMAAGLAMLATMSRRRKDALDL
jgi:hypothetical protein